MIDKGTIEAVESKVSSIKDENLRKSITKNIAQKKQKSVVKCPKK